MSEPDPAVHALLDDAHPGAPSRLYRGFVREHRCTDPATLDAWWAALQADQARGLHAVLLADYEWGARLQGAGGPVDPRASLRALLFERLDRLDEAGVQAWLQALDGGGAAPAPAGALDLLASEDDAAFTRAIDAVQAAIRDGETYQVNHTYRLSGRAHGEPVSLYRRLRVHQPVGYGAFIALPPEADADAPTHVLSRSPELFLAHRAGVVTARPMKGTAPRCPDDPVRDAATAAALAQDVKNRAENLMIVDLLRNDLGRLAQVGSVRVPALFAVEPYATVFQMTSTVEARLCAGVDLPALLRATYPCGSITGAPKLHTMGLIRRFESTPRGLYCGAIGWLDAADPAGAHPAMGDFCLSVAIRTLTLGAPGPDGGRPLRLGVGAGIVQDSVAADERAECRLKARFLTALDPGFELFETLWVPPQAPATAAERPRHLARLARSATALGFAWDAAAAEAALDAALATVQGPAPLGWRLRLALAHDGRLSTRHAVLAPLPEDTDGRWRLGWADRPLAAHPLSRHKTSHRAAYDAAVAQAEAQGLFDLLFIGAEGQVVEGGRSNVFARVGGVWWTPPLDDGALPGIARERALAEGLWGEPVRERRLWPADLAGAQDMAVGNALRGIRRARLVGGAGA